MAQATLYGRMSRNIGWLLGGKALGGLLSLVYLAVAARLLGPYQFGVFAIVLSFGQAIANLIQFQSSQLVIRFGAAHLHGMMPDRFTALLRFSALLDIGSAVASAAIGFLFAGLCGRLFGWSGDIVEGAQWFSLSLVFWLRATPTGVLRLLDRFDRLTLAETLTPMIRFAGAVAALAMPPSMTVFLVIWAISEAAASLLLWMFARSALRREGVAMSPGWPRRVTAENPGLWRFALASNATASTNLVWQQLGTLAVGAVVGTAAAGGYRIAFQIAQALAKPAMLLGRVIYPELARLGAAGNAGPAVWRSTAMAGIGGVAMVALTLLAGEPALALIAGAPYAAAGVILTILSISAAIDLAGFALEPALLAAGRAGHALIARIGGAIVYAGLLLFSIDRWGVHGVAWSAVAGSLAALVLSLLLVRRAGVRGA
ncbi:lipopolysaccharide biosynthesis protein [Sphingomonas colocasiae]|uniref:Oligosaccharide flippase family protein n=1 Tax=Sphingomonas colocasiae TaxID=1848973 RepID=A0ABS7PUJ4_9SPHN|nr:oligosaccharide flippase family protein [Sphingomonas colocasiae]MBY8824931.1 oligosaccharide flippase family protein [Sphingomonas colocasiae]